MTKNCYCTFYLDLFSGVGREFLFNSLLNRNYLPIILAYTITLVRCPSLGHPNPLLQVLQLEGPSTSAGTVGHTCPARIVSNSVSNRLLHTSQPFQIVLVSNSVWNPLSHTMQGNLSCTLQVSLFSLYTLSDSLLLHLMQACSILWIFWIFQYSGFSGFMDFQDFQFFPILALGVSMKLPSI